MAVAQSITTAVPELRPFSVAGVMTAADYLHQVNQVLAATLPIAGFGACAFGWFMFASYCGGLVKIMGFDQMSGKVAPWAVVGEFVVSIGLVLLVLPILFNNWLGI